MEDRAYRFVDDPEAPEIFCHHLHDVQFINGIARFTPIVLRKVGDEIVGRCPAVFLMPAEAVEPALELTYRKIPTGIIVPAIGRIVRRALLVH